MKATTIIIAAVLSLQVSFLSAGNNDLNPNVNNETSLYNIEMLAPVTPAEATFEDATETVALNFDLSLLAPVTPMEADFSDVVPEKNIDLTILAPVTPAEADFNESSNPVNSDLNMLAPVTPAEADFE
jgi:hypothetical protein